MGSFIQIVWRKLHSVGSHSQESQEFFLTWCWHSYDGLNFLQPEVDASATG